MANLKKENNQEKMDFLLMVLNENKKHSQKHVLYYSIFIIRYGVKVPVMQRESATTDIKEQIMRYSTYEAFKPDYIVVDLFTGKSRNVTKPIASFKFDYKSKF